MSCSRRCGIRRLLTQGGVLLTGVVLCLLVSTVYGGSPSRRSVNKIAENATTVALNNSVASAAVASTASPPATTEKPCNSGDCSNSEELLLPSAKGTVASGDPLVRTNHIGLTRYAANINTAEEIPTESSKPDPTRSTFDDRLSRLSAAINEQIQNRIKEYSTTAQYIQPTPRIEVAEAKNDEVWDKKLSSSSTEKTPELPDAYSREEKYLTTIRYNDDDGNPTKYTKTSTVLVEDGTSNGYSSSIRFTYSEPIKIDPTSVTMIVSTSGGYDVEISGKTTINEEDDKEDEPEDKKEEVKADSSNETIKNVNSTSIVHNDTLSSASDLTTKSVNDIINCTDSDIQTQTETINLNNNTIPVEGNITEALNKETTSSIEELLNLNNNKTEINAKIFITEEQNKKENESLNTKNSSTTEKHESSTKVNEDLGHSTSTQVVTTKSASTRRRYRPSTSTTPIPESTQQSSPVTRNSSRIATLYRGSTRFAVASSTPQNVYLESSSSELIPTITTYQSSSVRTWRPSTRPVSTTISPTTDAQPAESSTIECTTTEENSDTTITTPSEDKESMTHRSSVNRSRSTTTRSYTTSRTRPPHRSRPRTKAPQTEQMSTEEEETTTLEMTTTFVPRSHSDEEETAEPNTEATTRNASTPAATFKPEDTTIPEETEVPPTDLPRAVKAFLRLTVATTWEELCRGQDDFRSGIATLLSRGLGRDVSSERIVLLNDEQCLEPPAANPGGIPLHVYIEDDKGGYDAQLTESFPQVWADDAANKLQITCVDVRYTKDETMSPATAEHANVIAVIAIAGVAAGCLLLLVVLMLVMRKRQKRYNYGQRCTPVSLDAYSLDSVSVYNSVRRKGHLRASKRSYGNPAFDDTDSPSHPVNFAGLANCVGDVNALHEEFAVVPIVTARMDELPSGAEAKNRYANIIPLPETRVPLAKRGSDHLSEYINANFVRGPKNAPKYYIACQAPLESTVCDFWRMIWEHQCKVVLMLTDLEENGVEKCADYLPPSEVLDCHRLFGDFHVTLKKRETRDKYVVSTIQLKNMENNLWREVTHLWYFGWPATGVPDEANAVIALIIEARAFMKSNSGPTVVHCSPGTGRTGTVMACDLCIRDFEQSRMVDVPRIVHRLRRDRAGAVQTREQYAFIYKVLNVYAAKLTGGAMDSF